ncbi:hypothetical protein NIES2104_12540 [Leptolyngbya sp. NIES-2104]|nr:hypothetical protein NIES2104_12540 [Leptolyngbya sp. NIES-2104]
MCEECWQMQNDEAQTELWKRDSEFSAVRHWSFNHKKSS